MNTGFAIANPNDGEATVSFVFIDQDGNESGNGTLTIPAHGQIAKFLDEAPFNAPRAFLGAFSFNSNVPVGAIALRGLVNERAEFIVTTLPIANLDLQSPATTYFPHFADGAGWTTQVVLVNPSDQTIAGTLDFFEQGALGNKANVTTSIPYSIPGRSSRRFSTSGASTQIHVGSASATPESTSIAPVGVAIFSFKSAGVTVSEAGLASTQSGNAFRMYAESSMDGVRRAPQPRLT